MGSVGSNNTSSNNIVGKSVKVLDDIRKKNSKDIRETLNIPDATEKQLDTIKRLFMLMADWKRGYDSEKTPYEIEDFSIREIGRTTDEEKDERRKLGIKNYAPTIQISIRTAPIVDSSYIKMLDTSYHSALIGANGGLYTFTSNGKRKKLDLSDVAHGESM